MEDGMLAKLTSKETPRRETPILRFRKEGHVFPWHGRDRDSLRVCRQCTGLKAVDPETERKRLEEWPMVGWVGSSVNMSFA
jgi:hypothetical protein